MRMKKVIDLYFQRAEGALEKAFEEKFFKIVEEDENIKLGIWNGQYQCPACESQFGNKEDVDDMANAKKPYCHFCGQALDWGDDGE